MNCHLTNQLPCVLGVQLLNAQVALPDEPEGGRRPLKSALTGAAESGKPGFPSLGIVSGPLSGLLNAPGMGAAEQEFQRSADQDSNGIGWEVRPVEDTPERQSPEPS